MTVIKCVYTTSTVNKGRCVSISAGVNVCVFHLDVIGWAENKKNKLCEHGQTNIALQQVRPWTCYFPWGQTQHQRMNSIITHAHKSTSARTHGCMQRGKKTKHKQKHLSCQTSTPVNTQRYTLSSGGDFGTNQARG